MNRREFSSQITTAALALPLFSAHTFSAGRPPTYIPVVCRQDEKRRLPIPEGKRVPFGLNYFSLDVGSDGLILKPTDVLIGFKGDINLRLQVAIGIREQVEVAVFLPKTGEEIGTISIWYPTSLQLFETKLNASSKQILEQGILLKIVSGQTPLYLLQSTPENGSHFLVYSGSKLENAAQFPTSLYSFRSVQPFGWLEGCVLDGLQELHVRKQDSGALTSIKQHLALFLKPDGKLVYESPAAAPSDNRFNNLESGLPFAVIARYAPTHPALSLFVDYCRERIDAKGQVKDNFLSTEGCYTVAYPLAAVAHELNKPELYELALIELEDRIATLTDPQAVYTRAWKDKNTKTYRNWGRGYAWFLLGLVRSGEILQNHSPFKYDARLLRVRETYVYYANLALSHQQHDHSWRAYLNLPETGYDTSATAGIGAALAHGSRMGWLPGFSKKQLRQINERLSSNFTPDGFLDGINQHNAAGEALQKSEYRVIAQYVLGLMAHIRAHL